MPHAKNNSVKQPLESGSGFILRCLNCHNDSSSFCVFNCHNDSSSFCMFSFMTPASLFS